MIENDEAEMFDVSMSVGSTANEGRSYLTEQARVPLDETPMALATCLRALMGMLHPNAVVAIDPALRGSAPEEVDSSQSPHPDAHDLILEALQILKAHKEANGEHASLSAMQIERLIVALNASDALMHLMGGQVSRVRSTARVLLGENAGVPVFRDGAVELDGDRPDGSLLITLNPSLSQSELEAIAGE